MMVGSDGACLVWDGFGANLQKYYRKLREEPRFSNVTLMCEDGEPVPSHRIVLAAGSDFFSKVLAQTDHANPLIYLKGVERSDLDCMIDFLYYGEMHVQECHLLHNINRPRDMEYM